MPNFKNCATSNSEIENQEINQTQWSIKVCKTFSEQLKDE